MPKHGKKYLEMAKAVDRDQLFNPVEALELLKQVVKPNFDHTVEIAIRLGVDPRHADQQVRGTVVLPHGTGKTLRVLVFAKGDKAREAEEAGADRVGAEEIAEEIQKGWLDFDVAVATPDMMGTVGRLGKILGPKGLMPNPKTGTVTMDVEKAVKEIKAGKVEYRVDKSGIIHVPIGKLSFSVEQLYDNFRRLTSAVIKAKPSGAKGTYIKTIVISSTYSPGIRVSPQATALTATAE